MTIQTAKQLIDVGVAGDESTGDTLYDGGTLLNHDLDNVYNAFGDYRLFYNVDTKGEGTMILHPTGYYQKHTRAYYGGATTPSGNPVDIGSMHDVSVTRDGAGPLLITLPPGSQHEGEMIEFINVDNSISQDPNRRLTIRTSGSGDTIGDKGSQLVLTRGRFKLTMYVETGSTSGSKWNYRIENLAGDNTSNSQSIMMQAITTGSTREVQLFHKSQFHCMKYMNFVTQTAANSMQECSETLLLINRTNDNDNNVYSTEYARIRTGQPTKPEDDLLYEISYTINQDNYIVATVKNIGTLSIDVTIRSIEGIGD
ncbi:MAG: baseplate wedge tail fiber connector [Culicoidibacterales bacterium]